jgi:serine/threonine protein kinase
MSAAALVIGLAAKYRLLLLGQAASEGSFSLVYRAQHVDSGREVVIKNLMGAKFNARQVQSFVREVDKMKLLHHPSIPAVLDQWHSAQDMAMIVMPFVPGRTAQAAMDDNESDAALGLGLGLPVLGAAQAKPSGRPCTW